MKLLAVVLSLSMVLVGCKEVAPSPIENPSTPPPEQSEPPAQDPEVPEDDTVRVTGGDILLVAEPGATGTTDMRHGAIVVVDKNGTFKGTALTRDPDQEILRYPRGLRIEKDPFANEYYLVYGTTNPDLEMEVHRVDQKIIPDQEVELTSSTKVTNTNISNNNFFVFGFTGQNKSTGKRYQSDIVGGYPVITSYQQGAAGVSCKDYFEEGATLSGWQIGALFTGIGSFGVTNLIAARYKNGAWAVDEFNSPCSGSTLNLVSGDYGINDIFITDVTRFKSNGDTWHDDVFMTFRVSFGQPAVTRYDASNGFAADSSPFTDTARAMFWTSDSFSGNKIWTLEEDGSNYYIRRYDGSGNLEATVFTDTGKNIFHSTISAYLVVVPES